MRWSRRDGSPLPRSAYERGSTLYIRGVEAGDGGDYACEAVDVSSGAVVFTAVTTLTVSGDCLIFRLRAPPRGPYRKQIIQLNFGSRHPVTRHLFSYIEDFSFFLHGMEGMNGMMSCHSLAVHIP